MNAKSNLWSEGQTNNKGIIFERLVLDNAISILNDGTPTHYHRATGTTSIIDLTLCSSDCLLDFSYEVDESLHSSDHYPIHIKFNTPPEFVNKLRKFNTEKANWHTFNRLTLTDPNQQSATIDIFTETVTNILMEAARESIPCTSGRLSRPPVPWWNSRCDDAKRNRVRAERAMKRSNNNNNTRTRYSRARAICKVVFDDSKRESWKSYISGINSRTDINSVWKRVHKLSGKYKITPPPILEDENRQLQTSPEAVAEILSNHIVEISNTANANQAFARYKQSKESQPINMEGEGGDYNTIITMKELTGVLASCKESSPGYDEITYNMIKNAHQSMRELILKLYNFIFSNRSFPESWKTAIIIPIHKTGKDPRKATNYRPIALTSCLCKLLEKIINTRLIISRKGRKNI